MLGPLEVLRGGEPQPLGGPRQRAVLARLLVDAGRVVSTDVLIEDVWAGAPPTTAAKTLQRYVWRLRQTLGDPQAEVLRTQTPGYVLAPSPTDEAGEAVDVARFEQLLAAAADRRSRGDHAAAVATWRRAFGLWRGDVLADLPDVPFAALERARLGELRLAALESCLDSEIVLGRAAEVAAEAAELVEVHPLRERLWAALISALARSGRPVDALRAFERYRRLLADEVGLAPSAELRDLERSILAGGPVVADASTEDGASPVVGRLPVAATSFVGRAEQVAGIGAALAGSPLVTLTGPAGVGKTRLAAEVAAQQPSNVPGGVWFVELAPRHEGDAVTRAVAWAFGIDEQPGIPLGDTVVDALAHRPATWLVLDNCEHLLAPAAVFVDAVLRRCPSVRVLATSRHPLGLDAETVWPVPSLGDDAVELFADRARTAAPAGGFELTAANRPVVAELCRRLDGLPLAIELAASQVRVLEPGEIVDRLDDRLRLLVRPHGPTPRHRTLRATVAWSHDLLEPATRTVLARLGVFGGSFTLDAAEAVGQGGGVARQDVLHHVTALVDHSLLVREPRAAVSVARYRLLETIRLFAAEQLDASGEAHQRHLAHARFFLELARAAEPHFYGPDERSWRERLRADDHNLDGALRWAARHAPELGADLALALWFYWDATWKESAAVQYLTPLLEPGSELGADRRAWLLVEAAALGSHQGDARTPMAWAEQGIEAFAGSGDELGCAWAQHTLGEVLANQGALDQAEQALRAALFGFRRQGDTRATGLTLSLLGMVGLRRDDHPAAEQYQLEELGVWRRRGTALGQGTALRRLALSRLGLGDLAAAAAACDQARRLFIGLDDATSVAHVLSTEGDIARRRGDDDAATRLYRQALDGFLAVGDRRCTASSYKNLATVAHARGDHDQALALFRRAIVLRHELGDVGGLAECLDGLARCWERPGYEDRAAELVGLAAVVRDAMAVGPGPSDGGPVDQIVDRVLDLAALAP